MKHREVLRHKQRIDALFVRGDAMTADFELQAQWARYLCILISGYIENSIRMLYSDYCQKRSSREVTRFVTQQLNMFQNPKMERILDLIRMFSQEWEEELRQNTDGELKDSVDSIVANRHLIAHGRNVGISYANVKSYYRNATKVIDMIEELCDM